jgi:hypothetical protein
MMIKFSLQNSIFKPLIAAIVVFAISGAAAQNSLQSSSSSSVTMQKEKTPTNKNEKNVDLQAKHKTTEQPQTNKTQIIAQQTSATPQHSTHLATTTPVKVLGGNQSSESVETINNAVDKASFMENTTPTPEVLKATPSYNKTVAPAALKTQNANTGSTKVIVKPVNSTSSSSLQKEETRKKLAQEVLIEKRKAELEAESSRATREYNERNHIDPTSPQK